MADAAAWACQAANNVVVRSCPLGITRCHSCVYHCAWGYGMGSLATAVQILMYDILNVGCAGNARRSAATRAGGQRPEERAA